MWSGSRGCTTWTGYFKCWEVKTGFCRNRSMQPVLLGLSLAGNLVKPLLSLYGTEWRERGYGLRQCTQWPVSGKGGIGVVKFRPTHGGGPMGPQWRHQNRLSSANVVIVRRTHKSSRRGKEGGEDPVRERVKQYQPRTNYSSPKFFVSKLGGENLNITTFALNVYNSKKRNALKIVNWLIARRKCWVNFQKF